MNEELEKLPKNYKELLDRLISINKKICNGDFNDADISYLSKHNGQNLVLWDYLKTNNIYYCKKWLGLYYNILINRSPNIDRNLHLAEMLRQTD